MSPPPAVNSLLSLLLALAGTAALAWATARAARGRTASEAFAWMVIAGLAYSLLGLAAGVREPEGEGLRAAIFQMAAVLAAAALGGLAGAPAEEADDSGGALAVVALLVAWLSLLGLPPTAGFHSKVCLYWALASVGWRWALAAALAGSAAALLPAFRALSQARSSKVRGGRALLVLLLLAGLLVVGAYPQAGLAPAGFVVRLAGGA